ncbi:sulfite exporter TauE/SafE family protein [Nitrospirota bacterium]
MTEALALAITAGFLGGFGHCAGMCGPIVGGLAITGEPDAILPQLLYNTGRILTYTLIGALMGATGSALDLVSEMAGLQRGVMLLAGALMILMGLMSAATGRGAPKWIESHNAPVLKSAKKLLGLSSEMKFLPLGLVMGLMPCGLSYSMFIAAAGTGNPLIGALLLLTFGAGTAPAMLLVGYVSVLLGHKGRGILARAGGVAVLGMGILFIYRGTMYAPM